MEKTLFIHVICKKVGNEEEEEEGREDVGFAIGRVSEEGSSLRDAEERE